MKTITLFSLVLLLSTASAKESELGPMAVETEEVYYATLGQEHKELVSEISKNTSKPTFSNLTGVWSVPKNLVGLTFQLRENDSIIEGEGYTWGCLGIYDSFTVSGSRTGSDKLDLKFIFETKDNCWSDSFTLTCKDGKLVMTSDTDESVVYISSS